MKEVTVIMYIVIALFNAESGRPDVVSTINDFVFTRANQSAFDSFTIVNDSVLEFDELFIAEFNFGPEIANTWNAIKGEPSTAFIVIRDDDCELIHNTNRNNIRICIIFVPKLYVLPNKNLSMFVYLQLLW